MNLVLGVSSAGAKSRMETHRYVNDTSNPPLAVFFKDGRHFSGVGQFAPVGINNVDSFSVSDASGGRELSANSSSRENALGYEL